MAVNPYSRYQEQSVMTMTHGEMLTKLYDETIKQLNNGLHYLSEKDLVRTNEAFQKAQRIITYLKSTLDHKYDIAANLASLYTFFNEQIMTANIKKQTKPVEDILPLIVDLRDTFVQADKIARMEKQPSAGKRVG